MKTIKRNDLVRTGLRRGLRIGLGIRLGLGFGLGLRLGLKLAHGLRLVIGFVLGFGLGCGLGRGQNEKVCQNHPQRPTKLIVLIKMAKTIPDLLVEGNLCRELTSW